MQKTDDFVADFVLFCVFVWTHAMMLRVSSQFCTQQSLLVGLRGSYVLRSETQLTTYKASILPVVLSLQPLFSSFKQMLCFWIIGSSQNTFQRLQSSNMDPTKRKSNDLTLLFEISFALLDPETTEH